MMRAIVLTSNKLRHRYLLTVINKDFDLVGVICEDKGSYYDAQRNDSEVIKEHFQTLEKTENTFFNQAIATFDDSHIDTQYVDKNDINNNTLLQWAKDLKTDVIFLFGTGILGDLWLQQFPKKIINLHLGLSPFYRGSATLFWPFANDELECLGATIHLAVKKVDAGEILYRYKPEITPEDTYYTINYKIIKNTIDKLPIVAQEYLLGRMKLVEQVITDSKVYTKKDFNEKILSSVLSKYKQTIPQHVIMHIEKSQKCKYCQ